MLSLVAISGDHVRTQQAPPFQFHLLEATITDVLDRRLLAQTRVEF